MSLELLMLGNVPIPQMVERAKLAEKQRLRCRCGSPTSASTARSTPRWRCWRSHTERVQLGTCVTDPFARHPALTAMAIATLDEISNGRALLGFGAGISGFPELGIVRKKPAVAMREAIERDPPAAQGRDGRLQGRGRSTSPTAS